MAGVSGSQPSNIKSPVPNAQGVIDTMKDIAAQPVPSISAPVDDRAAFEAELAAQSAPSPVEMPAPEAPAMDDKAAFEAELASNPSMMEQIGQQASDYGTELKARFKAGFGGSIAQKANILKQVYGDANVEHDDEDIYVTKNGKKEKFTRGMMDMVKDAFFLMNPVLAPLRGEDADAALPNLGRDMADLGKQAIVEATALPAEIAGGMAGAAAANPVTAAAGVAAGRLAGGALGERFATGIGDMMGAEYAPNETEGQKLKRAAIGGTVRAVLGFGFDKVAAKIGTTAANRLAQREAARAQYLTEKAPGTPDEVAQRAVGAAKEIAEDVNHLVDNGILNPSELGGEGAVLLPNQANTAVPEFADAARSASETNQYRNFLSKQGEQLAKAWKVVAKAGDDMTGKVLEGAAKLAPQNPGQTLTVADRAWGGTIGQYRKEAVSNAGDQTFSSGRFKSAMEDAAEKMGFVRKADGSINWSNDPRVRPDAQVVADNLSITKDQAEQLISRMVKFGDQQFNTKGQLSLREMDRMYDFLAMKTKDAFGKNDVSYSFRGVFKNMRDGIRDDFTDALGAESVLGKAKQAEYLVARERFSNIKTAAEELGDLVDKDQMTGKAISQYLFGSGKDSLDRIRALKPVLEQENPGAWQGVVNQWMDSLEQQYAMKGDKGAVGGGINWRGLEKHLDAKPEILEEVFGAGSSKSLMSLIRVGRQIQDAGTGFTPKDYAKLANGIAQQAPGMKSNPIVLVRLLKGMGTPERSMREMLTRGGREEILKRVSEGNRSRVSKILDQVISDGTKKALSNQRGAPGGLMNPKNYVPDIRQLATPTAQTSQGMLTPSPDEE